MARAIYNHEVTDPDYSWLISHFREKNPKYVLVDVTGSPLVLVEGAPETEKQEDSEEEKTTRS